MKKITLSILLVLLKIIACAQTCTTVSVAVHSDGSLYFVQDTIYINVGDSIIIKANNLALHNGGQSNTRFGLKFKPNGGIWGQYTDTFIVAPFNIVDNNDTIMFTIVNSDTGTYHISDIYSPLSTQISLYVLPISTTGITKVNHTATDLSVYPNPAKDVVNITYSSTQENLTVDIYSIQGQLIKQSAVKSIIGKNHTSLSVSDLNVGFYFIRTNNQSIKFIKE